MHIFNSKSKKKELFVPNKENIANIYSCGPTVYDYAHLGHARNAIVFDLLHRILKQNHYDVFFVKNYTDIDDKIINKAIEENKSIQEISEFYINADMKDMESLSILPVSLQPKATEYINSMISLINKLLEKEIAYIISDGVYFDTTKDKKYGSISNRVQDDALNRVENNIEKKTPQDFALWKFETKKDISFDAVFGRGRPGWHTECSAMIEDIFSSENDYIIDIHCGGSDLLFPHHENEATQTRCATNKEITKYWMHNGFVQIDNEKMSKSLGNSFYLKDILKSHHVEVVRLYLMSVHYRANFNFTIDGLNEAKKILDKLYRLKKLVFDIKVEDENFEDENLTREKIIESLNDDMNIAKALSYINEFLTNSNEFLTKNKKIDTKNKKINTAKFFVFLDKVLGLTNQNPFEYFQFGLSSKEIKEINSLIEERDNLRAMKNYNGADEIKKILANKNISVMDTPSGSVWERI